MRAPIIAGLMAASLTLPALAQQQEERPTLSVAVSEEYGPVIVGANGLPVYAFLTELEAGDGETPVESCEADCREDWPPVTAEAGITVGEGLDPDLAATLEHEGVTFAVYNSQALFHFFRDTPGSEPEGHGLSTYGGWWTLLTPAGLPVEDGLLPAHE
jgi:predicted lipoprotein with Yx(FWY)xxD motif